MALNSLFFFFFLTTLAHLYVRQKLSPETEPSRSVEPGMSRVNRLAEVFLTLLRG